MENWIETYTGKKYEFLDPKPDQIDIKDIAFALSNKCRFSGHTRFFSVAEHSVGVAYRLPAEKRLAGLLHDAAEAYLGDIPSPIKHVLPDYKAMEKINEAAIFTKFGIELDEEVKQADRQALYTEAHFLIPGQGKDWFYFQQGEWKVDYDLQPVCLPPVYAYAEFMKLYEELTGTSKQIVLAYG